MMRFFFQKCLIYILIGILFFYSDSCNAQQIPLKFAHLTPDNGLSHTDAKDIKQDNIGFVWIATLFGLDRFDGYTIKSYYNKLTPQHNAFNNRIRSIYPDENGYIWMVTDNGIQCFDAKHERYLTFKTTATLSQNLGYSKIFKRRNGTLFTLKSNKPILHRIVNDEIKVLPLAIPPNERFYDALMDARGRVWLCSQRAIWLLDTNNQFRLIAPFHQLAESEPISLLLVNTNGMLSFVKGSSLNMTNLSINESFPYQVKKEYGIVKRFKPNQAITINDVIQDKFHRYWISTDEGLIVLNASLVPSQKIEASSLPYGLNTNRLAKLLIDRSECLWIASIGGGVNYVDLNAKRFHTLQHNPEQKNTLSGNHIRALLEENEHILWVGTHENGLNRYDLKNQTNRIFDKNSKPLALQSNVINALTQDKEGNLWIATHKGLEILAKDRTKLLKPKGHTKFPTYNIVSLSTDIFGNIWFGAMERNMGRISLDSSGTYRVQYFSPAQFVYAADKTAQVFGASLNGILHFVLDNKGAVKQVFRYRAEGNSNPISSNYVWPLRMENTNVLWAGTLGGGLNKLVINSQGRYRATSFQTKYDIFNDVECLEIDRHGKVWISGRGLEKFDPITNKTTQYDYYDGLQSNSFKIGASLKGRGDRLYFGGINGLNYFYPDSILSNPIEAKPVFTELIINNKRSNSSSELFAAVCFSKKIELNHLQNNILISFSAMHYANPFKCKFRYKLLGFDNEWVQTDGKNPRATYSNLAYGTYTLLLQATNNDGIWSSQMTTLSISVTPPWWQSTLAKVFYVIFFLVTLIGIYRYQSTWYQLKQAIKIKDMEEQKRAELHRHKEVLHEEQIQFFTNISHEFRTPLSLIIGPLEKLKREEKTTGWDNAFETMHRNALRLLNLINELMNLQKVTDKVISLQVSPIRTNDLFQHIATEFAELGNNKGITFQYQNDCPDTLLWLDFAIVEKIMLNLLTNAFKYTKTNGTITLSITTDKTKVIQYVKSGVAIKSDYQASNYVYFLVQDSGIGISRDFISKIFERYYRVSNEHTGSGVGLSLVKSLILLHKGHIYVNSEIGKGTAILVAIPYEEDVYTSTEQKNTTIEHSFFEKPTLDTYQESSSIELDLTETQPKLVEQVLIVEDNEELRLFMRSVLAPKYLIHEAPDGLIGFELAKLISPDLIISDVMMPSLDGISLCKMIKEDVETSHIPFMILSSKGELEAKIQGMSVGADYYFAKPFNIELLLLTVQNLFEQKRKLQQRYTTDYYSNASLLAQSTKDKAFLERFLSLIEENIQSEEIDISYLCEHFCISRTALYKKIKYISGQSVGEFIRTVRLKKAVHILTHENVTINEVVERIGLQSVSYFSRAFKKEFGKSPSVFIQELKK